MYFFSWARIETARDSARKLSACWRHHDADWPYLLNALYAVTVRFNQWVIRITKNGSLTVQQREMILHDCISMFARPTVRQDVD